MFSRNEFSPTSERLQDLRVVTRVDEQIEDQLDDLIDLLAYERNGVAHSTGETHGVESFGAASYAAELNSPERLPSNEVSDEFNDASSIAAWQAAVADDRRDSDLVVGTADGQQAARAVELTFVLPCLDQAHELADSILRLQAALDRIERRGEIIVVDLGSSDDSVQIAEELGARVIQLERGTEAGAGLERLAGREVLKQARGQVVVLGDCGPDNVSRWF